MNPRTKSNRNLSVGAQWVLSISELEPALLMSSQSWGCWTTASSFLGPVTGEHLQGCPSPSLCSGKDCTATASLKLPLPLHLPTLGCCSLMAASTGASLSPWQGKCHREGSLCWLRAAMQICLIFIQLTTAYLKAAHVCQLLPWHNFIQFNKEHRQTPLQPIWTAAMGNCFNLPTSKTT